MANSDPAVSILGSDPWMRFDLWSSRAWEAASEATRIAIESGPPNGSEDVTDGRIMALFYSAQLAREISESVNPMSAVAVAGQESESEAEVIVVTQEMLDNLLADDDE